MRPPLSVLIIYALGQLGWSLASYGVGNLLIYYYMPPENGSAMFPVLTYQGAVLGVLTVIGLLGAFGRVFDAFLDPMIGNWSDRSQAKIGKRRFFMALSAVPFAAFGFLAFFPMFSLNIPMNTAYLVVVLLFYYFFFTLYTIPYTALISELGHDEKDRMTISTLVSVTWALGFIMGNSIYALQANFEAKGLLPIDAFLLGQAILTALALFFMLVPVFFLNEKKYAKQTESTFDVKTSIRRVFSNKNYRYFLASDLFYWLALSFVQLGVVFFTTLLFGLDKSFAFAFSLIGFVTSFLLYIPVTFLTRKWGKKALMLLAFGVFCLVFMLLGFSDYLPLPAETLLYVLAVLSAFPLAVFGILPNALIGDEVEKEAADSGEQLSGMYYGVRAFIMKLGISLANLIFPSLLLLGKSIDNPMGARVSAFVATLFCLVGAWFFLQYQEPKTAKA